MAKYRSSVIHEIPVHDAEDDEASAAAEASDVADRSIGSIIGEARNLDATQIERILAYQREHGLRFGEAAVTLGYATHDDVMFALSRQFHYPYAPQERRNACPELVTLNKPFSAQAEAFRAVRSQLMVRLYAEPERRDALAVVSPQSGDGRSYFAANLAVALAQLGGRTLLVDADLRRPRQHEVFGLQARSGLSGILAGRAESNVIQQVPGIASLFVLPVGAVPPNPVELVERPAFGLLTRELLTKFDHVVVDTPAAASGSDFAVIAARCGASLLLARRHQSRLGDLREVSDTLGQGASRTVGVVVNEF